MILNKLEKFPKGSLFICKVFLKISYQSFYRPTKLKVGKYHTFSKIYKIHFEIIDLKFERNKFTLIFD